MKRVIILSLVLCLFAITSNAQNKVDNALGKANSSVNGANANVDSASKNVSSTIGAGKKLVGMFAKKPEGGPTNTTVITVKNAKFGIVNKLTESIQGCTDVQDAKMKYSADGSTITVTHTGTTAKLLKSIEKKTPVITAEVVDNVDDGAIAVTLR
jgi:hypothetical protein